MTCVRWRCYARGLTNFLEPLTDEAGAPLELLAPDKATALRLAREKRWPPAGALMSVAEFDALRAERRR